MAVSDSWRVFADTRLWRVFLLGFSSGFPALIIGSSLSAWLKDSGIDRASIGLLSIALIAYSVNFLWAPFIDHCRIPFIGRLGRKRSWILTCQCVLALFTFILSSVDPYSNLAFVALTTFGIAATSATQDLPIDAYRITVFRENESQFISPAAAFATCGWWSGVGIPGVIAFWFVDDMGWSKVYECYTLVWLLLVILVFFAAKEPVTCWQENPVTNGTARCAPSLLSRTYLESVREFFTRNGIAFAFAVLGFILLFKIGEAFLGRMVIVFYKEVGFTSLEIGNSKALAWFVNVLCAISTAALSIRWGIIRVLFGAGIVMALTNLFFSWIALIGPEFRVLALAVVLDGMSSAIANVAFVAFISSFVSRIHTATQYSALASLGTSGRTLLAASSGFVVDFLDGNWALFFAVTSLMVLPSLAVLTWIAYRNNVLKYPMIMGQYINSCD